MPILYTMMFILMALHGLGLCIITVATWDSIRDLISREPEWPAWIRWYMWLAQVVAIAAGLLIMAVGIWGYFYGI